MLSSTKRTLQKLRYKERKARLSIKMYNHLLAGKPNMLASDDRRQNQASLEFQK